MAKVKANNNGQCASALRLLRDASTLKFGQRGHVHIHAQGSERGASTTKTSRSMTASHCGNTHLHFRPFHTFPEQFAFDHSFGGSTHTTPDPVLHILPRGLPDGVGGTSRGCHVPCLAAWANRLKDLLPDVHPARVGHQ